MVEARAPRTRPTNPLQQTKEKEMLLNDARATQQSLYAEIQAQIDARQEKQREIQAYLQRLGSVESKMESAAALWCSLSLGGLRNVTRKSQALGQAIALL